MRVPAAVLLFGLLAACREPQGLSGDAGTAPGAAAAPDAGPEIDSLVIPPADAGPAEIAEAERLALRLVHHPDAPRIRLDLRVELSKADFFGLVPIAPAAALIAKLGQPASRAPTQENDVTLWRWPDLGAEATVLGGTGVARIALHAREHPEAGMKLFPGAVLLEGKSFTEKAPHLFLREVVLALGPEQVRIRGDQAIRELGLRSGTTTLYLVFDAESLLLESLYVEPNDEQLWATMKPAAEAKELWEVQPPDPERDPARIQFAQLPEVFDAGQLAKMPLVGKARPNAKLLFDNLELRFLKPGEKLRRIGGGRVALLRAELTELAVLEKGASWEARRLTGTGRVGKEQAAVARIEKVLLAPPAKP